MAVAAPKVPALVPRERVKLKALAARPVIALPFLSVTAMVIRSVLPDATVGVAKPTVDLAGLTGPGITCTVGLALSVTPLTVVVSVLAEPAVVAVKTTM